MKRMFGVQFVHRDDYEEWNHSLGSNPNCSTSKRIAFMYVEIDDAKIPRGPDRIEEMHNLAIEMAKRVAGPNYYHTGSWPASRSEAKGLINVLFDQFDRALSTS